MLPRQLANLGLGHAAERKESAAELLLREAEEKVSLVLAAVGGTLEQPASAGIVVLHAGVVAGGNAIGADLLRDYEQLIKLQMIVAEAARDGRASREILGDERTHDVALETLFVIDHVIRNAEVLGDAAGVVNIVERAAAAGYLLGHALVSGEAALVPELHSQADDVVSFGAQHGRDGGGIDSARHGYGYGLTFLHVLFWSDWRLANSNLPFANC